MTPNRVLPGTNGAAGFTLLELVGALVVCGLLLAGLTQGSHLVMRFADRQHLMLNAVDDLDTVDRTLRGLLEQMEPGARIDPYEITGTDQSLQFISRVPGWSEQEVTRRSEVRLRLDDRKRLVLLWTPRLHATAPRSAVSEVVLLHDVEGITINYRTAEGWRERWHDHTPPMQIRIHIAFAPGDPRLWPDIVAAPMLAHGDY